MIKNKRNILECIYNNLVNNNMKVIIRRMANMLIKLKNSYKWF